MGFPTSEWLQRLLSREQRCLLEFPKNWSCRQPKPPRNLYYLKSLEINSSWAKINLGKTESWLFTVCSCCIRKTKATHGIRWSNDFRSSATLLVFGLNKSLTASKIRRWEGVLRWIRKVFSRSGPSSSSSRASMRCFSINNSTVKTTRPSSWPR